MNTNDNTFKGFLFFLLRLISVALVVVILYLAYDLYNDYKTDKAIEYLGSNVDLVYNDILNALQRSLK